MRILVVEDDRRLGNLIVRLLQTGGFTVDHVTTGREALDRALADDYAGLVLDLGLTDRGGLSVLQELRQKGRKTPVLVLTGEADESTIVRALDAGADEYVIKPVSGGELAARVRALVRRPAQSPLTDQVIVGRVRLERLSRVVAVGDTTVNLSPREFSLLEFLMLNRDQVVTRSSLLEHVWGMNFDPGTNVIDVQVGRVRRKLDLAGADLVIETLRGRGIRLRAD